MLKIIKLFYISLITGFYMRTPNFFSIPHKRVDIYARLCTIYDITNPNTLDDSNINLVKAIDRITKLEETIPLKSKALLMEAHHFGDYGICCFLGTIEDKNYTLYNSILLNKEKDSRAKALKELKILYNLELKNIGNKKWYLDYLIDK